MMHDGVFHSLCHGPSPMLELVHLAPERGPPRGSLIVFAVGGSSLEVGLVRDCRARALFWEIIFVLGGVVRVEPNRLQRQSQRPIVGLRLNAKGVADDVVDIHVFYGLSASCRDIKGA